MKGKLINGRLYIEKDLGNNTSSDLMRQICPYTSNIRDCSISCPLFGNILSGVPVMDGESGTVFENGTEIHICQGRTLTFSEFSVEK